MTRSISVSSETVATAFKAAQQTLFEFDPATDTLAWADIDTARALLSPIPNASIETADGYLNLIDGEHLTRRESAVSAARAEKRAYSVEYRIGEEKLAYWVEERGTWLPRGESDVLIAMVRRIDAQKEREEALNYLATYDELTGQLNRASFKEKLSDWLDGVREGTRNGCLLLVGVDNVGSINNDFGFDVADQVIVEVASRIEDIVKGGTVLGRLAGTKFGVLLAADGKTTLYTTVREIMTTMRERVVETGAGGIAVSVCIGASELRTDMVSAAAALKEVEAAFDQARRAGASSFKMFSEQTETISQRRQNTEISDVILTALNDRGLYLSYQPIVSDVGQAPTHFECLARMRSAGEELPAPKFIPAAERLGLVHLIDRRVLELALGTLRAHPDITLAVNLSWETVRDPLWAEGYIAHLRSHCDVTSRLTLELTETQLVNEIEPSRDFVTAIKKLGCKFAIDDFGAGYTSFRNLKALDIDILKIDGSFVSGLTHSRENQLFVRTLLDLARNFGTKTVAEWVDNASDAQLLKALGVDHLQGFFIGRPGPLPQESDVVPAKVHSLGAGGLG
ncbi:hypothetical protein PB2503_07729 [Parvularcula bermudensis HTCC2503]|uniref:Uncharacterized protein n=1 Tax=Parvularcula bermudensis (strain ATCC BAA-594 / HTCC2503 / KCTC 12087) TaxID=314260 RepID=E0TGI2_PARBH|nr:bifunctional diguanylate cyclase/phosphodiesterase [Parvularcula bermudensis]ADM09601.1 hypothetical protein PB2503_07729 [Parvularcula bermudensis HTCC2503]